MIETSVARLWRGSGRRGGMTLAEVTVASAATAILVGGVATSIVFATRALPESGSGIEALVATSEAVEVLSSELMVAMEVTEHTDRSIEFTLADRTGDLVPEVIRYIWSGVAGAPLTRAINGSTPVVVLEEVDVFSLIYEVADVPPADDVTDPNAPEALLAEWTGLAAVVPLATTDVAPGNWVGMYFEPDLPDDAIHWAVTRVSLRIGQAAGTADGVALLAVYAADAARQPTGDKVAQATIQESALPASVAWRDIGLSQSKPFDRGTAACIVLQHSAFPPSCRIEYQTSGVAEPTIARVRSSDFGASWDVRTDRAALFRVYGKVTGKSAVEQRILSLRINLGSSEHEEARIESAVTLLNEPEFLP